MRGGVTDAGRTTNNQRTLKIELLSQWKLEAEFRKMHCVSWPPWICMKLPSENLNTCCWMIRGHHNMIIKRRSHAGADKDPTAVFTFL